MKITRKSPFTGKINTLDLPISQEQWKEWNSPDRRLIQDVFPNLTPEHREFIKTGMLNEDWDELFPEEDGDDDL